MTRRPRLIWKVAPAFLAVIALSTVIVAWYAGDVVARMDRDRTVRELTNKSNLLATMVEPLLGEADRDRLKAEVLHWGKAGGVRVTVMLPGGKVIADSHENPGIMENHASRAEMAEALAGRVGQASRYSNTLRKHEMYVARPIARDGAVVAVVRAALASDDAWSAIRWVYSGIAVASIVTILLGSVVVLYLFNRYVGRPLRAMQQSAERFSAGHLREPMEEQRTLELAALTDSLSKMARQLDEKIRTVTQQAMEQRAVLAGMIEGVIAVDADERVIMLNAAAAKWLDVDMTRAHGRKSFEVMGNLKLQDLIAQALDSEDPVEAELLVRGEDERLAIQAQAAPLWDQENQKRTGVVVVLHDVTRLRRLENVRQQFVSNVSHELKTPIAAIKAAVETIIDEECPAEHDGDGGHDAGGAAHLSAAATPSNGNARFLGIIARQADRLNAIVEDLLMLARIEEEEQDRKLATQRGPVLPVLAGAVETCQSRADDKRMAITIEADPAIEAAMNAPLLEQAMVNMLDNAIKYSPAETSIWVRARKENGEVVLSVKDEGPGIEKVHLPRVFERFYRTDKARSRALGGTGLGLAIVKHVAQSHGGRVSVDSSQEEGPNRGSTFRIHLPVRG